MNTKRFIIIALVTLILAGCASNKPDNENKADGSTIGTTAENAITTEEPAVTTEAETIAVLPPVPEEVPDIPDSKIEFSNDFLVIQVDTSGTTYANGVPVESSEADLMVQQAVTNQNRPSNTTATKAPEETGPITAPNVTMPEETERPTGTIFIDDTIDKDDDNKNEDTTDIFFLAKYVNSGKTDLAITDIVVYSSAKPGVNGVDKFNSGDTMLVNLWCNPTAVQNTTVYVVPASADHATSYEKDDCLLMQSLDTAFGLGENQMFFEIELPDGIVPAVYELRFVCNGVEEGYIPYHLG